MYSCTAEEPCFCESEQIETSMSACLEDSGCSFDDQLAAMKFQAETCGERTRDRGPLLSGVTYTLFGVATLFTIARAISRWPKFGGAGFGLDDYTAFVAYTLLTAMTAGNWFAIHCGKGRYIYTLSANSVSLFLMVRKFSSARRNHMQLTSFFASGSISATFSTVWPSF